MPNMIGDMDADRVPRVNFERRAGENSKVVSRRDNEKQSAECRP